MNIGLLLEGGATRGLYTAGVLDVFLQREVPVDGIVGVSAGALFGMNYKSRQMGRVLRYNLKYAPTSDYMGLRSLLTTGDIINREFCFERIVNTLDPVDFDTYRRDPTAFYAVATDMETGRAEYRRLDDLRQRDQLEFLRASGSMPFVSAPVPVGGRLYLDGGIADSIPIDAMLDMGFDRIIAVLTRPAGYRKKPANTLLPRLHYGKFPALVSTMNSRYLTYNRQLDRVEQLAGDGAVFLIRPSALVPIKRLERDTAMIQAMYDLGRQDGEAAMAELRDYLHLEDNDQ